MHLTAPPRATSAGRSELRATLRLATPIALAQLGQMGMGTVDVLMVGNFSSTALAGIALGNVLFWTLTGFGYRIVMALDPLVAQPLGAGDDRRARRAVQTAMVLPLVITLPLTLIGLFAHPILALLGQPLEVRESAASYVLWSLPGILPFLVFCSLRQCVQAMSKVRPVLIVMLAANLLNLVLDWMFVFGKFGLPAMGLQGAAMASNLSRLSLAVLLAWLSWPTIRPWLSPWSRRAMQPYRIWNVVRLGLPIGGAFLLESGAFSFTAIAIGWIGSAEVGGHQIALTLASLSFMVPVGISSAAAVRVGYAVGRRDPAGAAHAARSAIGLGALVMILSMAAFLLFPEQLAALFLRDSIQRDPDHALAVLAFGAAMIGVAGVFQVVDGIQVVCVGVLRGLGDTRTPFVVHLLAFWALGIPVGLLLAFETELGAAGMWWGLVLGLGFGATVLLLRCIAGLRRLGATLAVTAPDRPRNPAH